MGRMNFWIPLGLLLVALACAPQVRVTTTVEPGTDWSAFETYSVVPPPEVRTSLRETLESAITGELDQRGYRAVPLGGGSDLLVVVQTTTQAAQRQVFAESPGGCCRVEHYIAGTLHIDVFDARSSLRIWRGVGDVDIQSQAEADLRRAATGAVSAVLASFPRRPSGEEASTSGPNH